MVTEKKRQKEEKHPKKNIPQYFISEERKKEFNILLAEDEIINQTVVKIILERLGYSVDIFSNGKDAVEALKQTPYDLVLMSEACRRGSPFLPPSRHRRYPASDQV